MTTFVAYCRVSTAGQGRSGLGLEAQDAAIRAHLRSGDTLLQPPYVEVESGKRADRPQLQAAVDRCRRTGATLLIAKLDRLSRDAHFLLGLEKAGIEFVCADMPNANRLTIGIMAIVAEEERRMISQRTKSALAAAKARGTKLGGDRGYRPEVAPDAALATAVRKRKADHAAYAVLPVVEGLQAEGVGSLNAMAKRLNDLGHRTPRAGEWTATAVKRLLARVV